MKNQPTGETHKENFYDLIKHAAHPLSGPGSLPKSKFQAPQARFGPGGNQLRARNFGGASGRHGGRSS
jgi:hypothetical protein